MTSEHSSGIQWRDWSNEAFEQAEREDKLILLNIGAPWCHWCHVMERVTYSDPEVIRLVAERFVPVKVEADQRPDIQDHYLLGGWPTTAFLIPDGRIVTGTTFVPPEALINKLHEVDVLYHEHKELVTMHVTSMAAEAEADRAQSETGVSKLNGEIIDRVAGAINAEFDSTNGGFGREPKFPYPDAIRFAFLQHRRTGDREMLEVALKTLDGMMNLYDPVWGGFYRYAVDASWKQPHYEKMLYVQAAAVDNYLEAYQVTGDDKYGEIAAGVKAYVNSFLCDQEHGGFYASQDADVGSHDPGAELIVGEEFFSKDDRGRNSIGMPYVDKTIYTDWNGMMVSAYCRLYQVLGDAHALEFAIKTIDRLMSENMREGCMYHYADGDPQLPGLASDQVYFAQGLLDAYQCTGEPRFLACAETLTDFVISNMQDVVDGGFYYEIDNPHAIGQLSERHKPFEENAAAARLLLELHYLTGKADYRDLAARTIKAVSYPQIIDTVTGASLAAIIDLYMNPPTHIVLVGKREDERTRLMLESSLHAYAPRKLVQVLDPTCGPLTIGDCTYEEDDEPTAYVCIRSVCAEPVKGPDRLNELLEDVLGGAPS